ncbi:MAG TPA: hypothetical protein VNO26_14260 [Candidatus Limnocylindria bacterium]|nr:hypothetical protein [Candidatus Limnocylindria bacterium]
MDTEEADPLTGGGVGRMRERALGLLARDPADAPDDDPDGG